jgi:hypothetical protein
MAWQRWITAAWVAAVFFAVLGSASVAEASPREPANIFQCKQKYKTAPKQQACIRSLGSSCAHPVMREYARDGEHLGNKHMEIWEEVSKDETPEYFIGPHLDPPQVTNYISISVTTDSKMSFCEVELKTYEGPNGEIVKRHRLHTTTPHEGGAFILGITEGGFRVVAFGRYTKAAAARSSIQWAPTAKASSQPKTPFQCGKRFHTSAGRTRCFAQLPGADCGHPLIAEKASATTRGEHQYFKLGFNVEPDGGGGLQHYSYRPASPNVAICPHGVVYKVSLLRDENHCELRHHHGHAEEYCSVEYNTKSIPEPSGAGGGSFTYYLTSEPHRSAYLVIKGYFIHPPWAG